MLVRSEDLNMHVEMVHVSSDLRIVRLFILEVWNALVMKAISGPQEMQEQQHVPGLPHLQEISPIGMFQND